MKKSVLLFLAACLFLTGCSSQTSNKSKSTESNTTEISTSKAEDSSSQASTSSSSAEEVEKVESYQYNVEQEGVKQVIKETLVYKGDKFLKMELHITQEATEEMKTRFAGYDFDTVKTELVKFIDEQAFTQQLREVSGVNLETDVTQDYSIILNVKIDMATVDLQALSNVEGIGADLTELENITPATYILGLKLKGAEKVQ